MDRSTRSIIIDYIRRNRVSSTEIADCLGKSGAIPLVLPLTRGHFEVGPIRWVYAFKDSNWDVHDQIRSVQPGEIVLVEPFDCGDRAIFGDIVCKFLALYKRAAAIVVMGKVRDAHRLIKENWPLWCTGVSPVGCFNSQPEMGLDSQIISHRRRTYDGTIAVCDDSGVVIIPCEQIASSFIQKLELIEEQEDIWYDCINRRKMDTFDTICLKKYKESQGIISSAT